MARRLKGTLCLGTALALILPQSTALAQSADNVTVLEAVTVKGAGKGDKHAGAADRSNSITVSEDDIEAARFGNLKDLFASDASITVGGAMPIGQKIFVNGVDMLNLAVTVDGVSQNNRGFHHVSANAIDPGLLKAVRVDPTVAPADAGPQALAGSIVFETVDVDDVLEEGRSIGGFATLGFETNGRTLSEAASIYGRDHQGFEYLGYVKNAKGKNYETGDGWTIPGTAADLQSYLAKAAIERDGHRFEFSAQSMRDGAFRPYRSNFGGVIGGRPTPETRLYDTLRQNYSLRYEMVEPVGLWDPEIVIGYSRNDIDVPEPWESEGTSYGWSGKVENTFHFDNAHALTAGIDFYDRTGIYEGPGERYEEKASNVGLYLQDRIEIFDRLKLSFGGRADMQRFEGIGGFSTDVSGLSGNASLAYEVIDDVTLKAGYSNVFGGITLEDNYIYRSSWDYTSLEASRAKNYIAGVEYTPGDFLFEAEVFSTHVTNARNAVTNIDFDTKGFNLGAGFTWVDGLVKVTYSNTEIDVDGEPGESFTAQDFGAPLGEIISVNAQHRFDDYDVTVGARLDIALKYDGTLDPANNRISLPGYEVVNLYLQYEPKQIEGLQVRLEANNIFDEAYADRGTYGSEYAGEVIPLYEPGRSFLVSVKKIF